MNVCSVTMRTTEAGLVVCAAVSVSVPNAIIQTQAPYTTGDLLTFVCLPGFSMSGSASLVCGSDGSFQGTLPVCTADDHSETASNDDSESSFLCLDSSFVNDKKQSLVANVERWAF